MNPHTTSHTPQSRHPPFFHHFSLPFITLHPPNYLHPTLSPPNPLTIPPPHPSFNTSHYPSSPLTLKILSTLLSPPNTPQYRLPPFIQHLSLPFITPHPTNSLHPTLFQPNTPKSRHPNLLSKPLLYPSSPFHTSHHHSSTSTFFQNFSLPFITLQHSYQDIFSAHSD